MIEVEVLYADLTRQCKPLDDADQLSTDEVLFIIVRTDTEVGKLNNIAVCFGKDRYALCRRHVEGQDWIMLCGWDEDDFVWRRLDNPHDIDGRRQVDAPLGCFHMIFDGQHVEAEAWAQAQDIFSQEMT